MGMVVMLVAGVRSDLRVRALLRQRLEDEDREERALIDRTQQDLFSPLPREDGGDGEGTETETEMEMEMEMEMGSGMATGPGMEMEMGSGMATGTGMEMEMEMEMEDGEEVP